MIFPKSGMLCRQWGSYMASKMIRYTRYKSESPANCRQCFVGFHLFKRWGFIYVLAFFMDRNFLKETVTVDTLREYIDTGNGH